MKKYLLLLLFIPLISFGQKDIKDAIQICTSFSNFESLDKANETLELILDAAGLTKNFSLFPCDGIPNAAAFTFNGDRYIFYNEDFMKKIKNEANEISNIFTPKICRFLNTFHLVHYGRCHLFQLCNVFL